MFEFVQQHLGLIAGGSFVLVELAGIITAVRAVMHVRTAQGAVAWLIALITLPIIALPMYAVFGRRRFSGYVDARRARDQAVQQVAATLLRATPPTHSTPLDRRWAGFEQLAGAPFLTANNAELLVEEGN